MVRELMEDFGYEPGRLMLAWCSAAEPERFVAAVTEMTERVRTLGPVATFTDRP